MSTHILPGEADTRLAPGSLPVCTTCGQAEPAIADDERTACCAAPVYAFQCEDCEGWAFFTPSGEWPDFCPHCDQ